MPHADVLVRTTRENNDGYENFFFIYLFVLLRQYTKCPYNVVCCLYFGRHVYGLFTLIFTEKKKKIFNFDWFIRLNESEFVVSSSGSSEEVSRGSRYENNLIAVRCHVFRSVQQRGETCARRTRFTPTTFYPRDAKISFSRTRLIF